MPDHLGEDMRKVKNEEEKEEKEIKCNFNDLSRHFDMSLYIHFLKSYFLYFQHWMKAISLC